VSILTNRYGCKNVTIAGSLIAAFGFIISYFANGIVWLCLSFGIVGGKKSFFNYIILLIKNLFCNVIFKELDLVLFIFLQSSLLVIILRKKELWLLASQYVDQV
jgi:PREDICTED: similar to monocarboxylate transporter